MKLKLLLSLFALAPGLAQACSLAPDFADYYRNDLVVEVLRDYRVQGTVDNARDIKIENLEVLPFYTFRGRIPCPDSVKMSGSVRMNLMRKVSKNLRKSRDLDEALARGEISEQEHAERLAALEACHVEARVESVKKPQRPGEMAYRFDSEIGIEISCD